MEYTFNDRKDLEDVQGLRDKLQACIDMIHIYVESFGYDRNDMLPDKVVISTAINERELYCMLLKNGKRLYCIELCQMYGFGNEFYCKSDIHLAAQALMAYINDAKARASKTSKRQSIKLGGA